MTLVETVADQHVRVMKVTKSKSFYTSGKSSYKWITCSCLILS